MSAYVSFLAKKFVTNLQFSELFGFEECRQTSVNLTFWVTTIQQSASSLIITSATQITARF